ncbi:hypothetical protein LCGC14_2486040 [marine sediment metagenome]|uniref:Uncharacterized protein n=1 Tax=marine sediment metagenome TaxID=412755 RepID=A0A0F9BU09_9ZZZZ
MPKEAEVKRISEVVPASEVIKPIFKAQEYMETDFVITDFEVRNGSDGKFYIIDAYHLETKTHCVISTGSWMVDKQLQALDKREDLPLRMKFVPQDRSYFME